MLELRPGTVVLHPDFGAGTVVANDGNHIEIEFKLRGRKKLMASIAGPLLTQTGFKHLSQPGPTTVNLMKVTTKASRKAKKKAKAKAIQQKKDRAKRKKAKARKIAFLNSSRAGRAGGDRWEWEQTTPNTPLYREGRR